MEGKTTDERGSVGSSHCPLCGERFQVERVKRKLRARAEDDGRVPMELADLELYRLDRKLCLRWERLYKSWKVTFKGLDVLKEVRTAHSWEMSNPQRQKRDRPRFLHNWLSRQSDRPRVPWVKGGDLVAPEAASQAAERELVIGEILEGKDGANRVGKSVPWRGRTYEVQPQGLLYVDDHRILPWSRLTTEDMREILRRVDLYEHASEVW